MKTITLLSMTFISLISFSCQASLSIFACEPEWASLANELGGEKVDAFSATTGKQDPHLIQARPSLIAKMRNADMVACTGAELEAGWLPLLLQRAANSKLQAGRAGYFMASEFVILLGIPQSIDRSQGDVHAAGNPHIQTSPENILRVAKAMSERLAALDPANSLHYQERYKDFKSRWKNAMKRWQAQLEPLKQLPIVVHHNSWLYLEEWMGLNRLAALEEKSGIPPTSGHLSSILNQMKTQPAKVIIYAAYQSDKPARWLSDKTAIPVLELPFTVGGNEQVTDLFSLFDDTIQRLLSVTSS